MARQPARYICDLCKEEIADLETSGRLAYPFNGDDLAQIMEMIAGDNPIAHRILGIVPLPSHHEFHFCKRCIDGFLPMADAMKALAISLQSEEWKARRAKYEAKRIKDDEPGEIRIDDDGRIH
jgi:hypothetical protein